jgi:polynucleotide 5'-kinase involved in rRNA processing
MITPISEATILSQRVKRCLADIHKRIRDAWNLTHVRICRHRTGNKQVARLRIAAATAPSEEHVMTIVVAFVSQKGGVGKSTLTRALATSAVRAGLTVKTVDLDPHQATITVWAKARDRYEVSPSIKVDAFRFVKDALASASGEELVIVDTPGGISDAVAERAHPPRTETRRL